MHLVYRRAEATVVVLSRHVYDTQDMVGLLRPLSESEPTLTIRERIFGDRWFTRAWCVQECMNSNIHAIYYLVGWREGVDEHGREWEKYTRVNNTDTRAMKQTLFREWVLRHGNVWSMSFHVRPNVGIMITNMSSREAGTGYDAFTLLDEGVRGMKCYQGISLLMTLGRSTSPREDTKKITLEHSTFAGAHAQSLLGWLLGLGGTSCSLCTPPAAGEPRGNLYSTFPSRAVGSRWR
jgi:hypothetical protein